MKMSKQQELSDFVGDLRADSEAITQDREVAEAFDEEQRKQDINRRNRLLGEARPSITMSHVAAGDVDVVAQAAETIGEEAPGGGNPTPDQAQVDDIGHAVGLTYEADELLHTEEKLLRRDRRRWELDPASAEDYAERHPD